MCMQAYIYMYVCMGIRMCCLAFLGFLRSSEFTVPSQYEYDGSVHLSVQDISTDSRSAPRMIRVRIE